MGSSYPSPNLLAERKTLLHNEVAVLRRALADAQESAGLHHLDYRGLTDGMDSPAQDADFTAFRHAMVEVIEEAGVPGFGMIMGARRDSRTLGVFGIGMATSMDLAQVLRFPPRAIRLVWDQDLHFAILRDEGAVVMRYEPAWAAGSKVARTLLEMSFMQCIRIIQEILPGLDWSRCEVRMRGPAPGHAAEYPRYFPCRVQFGQAEDEFRMPLAWLEHRPVLANQNVAAYCEALGRSLVEEAQRTASLKSRVRAALDELEPAGPPTLKEVARALEITERSLRSGLAREGVSFRAILHHHRLVLARRLLRDSPMPIKEIAFRLGFAQLPSFYRAFTRETGRTPDQYRASTCP